MIISIFESVVRRINAALRKIKRAESSGEHPGTREDIRMIDGNSVALIRTRGGRMILKFIRTASKSLKEKRPRLITRSKIALVRQGGKIVFKILNK
ncbi:hypothetical protein EVA_02066 [gut metagenome]|uniref:Uncharacterized protein n=1 Tax=gut metagenome TaxID=749906 RepID=J9GPX4_9ZZZZ